MSNDSVIRRDDGSKEAVRAEDDSLFQLNKSNSVVAKVSMFAQLEEDMKRAAKEAKTRKFPNASNRCVARREDVSQSGNRFATQPVTMGEVEEAVRSASSRDPDSTLAGMSNKLVEVLECVLARKCLFSRRRVRRSGVFSPGCARGTQRRKYVQLRRNAVTYNSNFKVVLLLLLSLLSYISVVLPFLCTIIPPSCSVA